MPQLPTCAPSSDVAEQLDRCVEELVATGLCGFPHSPRLGWYVPLKHAADFVIALLLLIPGLPIILLAALAVKLTSRGPAFYCQKRLGRGGRVFTVYKLRSMVVDAEKGTGPVWAATNDPRITKVGRFLRDSHIDEFPQLFNVLRGQMSLIGPRPERPELTLILEQDVPRYRDRLRLRPGITGLTQLRLPADSDVASVRRKLVCDLYYIRHVAPWLDARIMIHTAYQLTKSVCLGLLAPLRPKLGLPRWKNVVEDMAAACDVAFVAGESRPNADVTNEAADFVLSQIETQTNASARSLSAPGAPRPIINALTVDVEDYFHVGAFADRIAPGQWDGFESRVVNNTERLLKLFDELDVRGTFFVLGWVADRFPDLVRQIRASGHDVGCHSFWHRPIYDLTPDEFREDLVQSRKVLEEILGEEVTAYRAPSFSITADSLWALDVLVEEGFRYDSSIFPIHHDRYGIPGASRSPHVLQRAAGSLIEFPPTAYPLGKVNVPVGGGGYFRLYPGWLSMHLMQRVNRDEGLPVMFYVHPWEIDPEQPRLAGSLKSKFRHYTNLHTTEHKLRRMLETMKFGTLAESYSAFAAVNAPEEAPTATIDV